MVSESCRYEIQLHERMLRVVDVRPGLAVAPKNTPRGKIAGISGKSRYRLIRTLAQISRPDSPFFITLTYRQTDENFSTWKADLNRWKNRLAYHYPNFCGLWRQQFQERGAAHFHLLLWLGATVHVETEEKRMADWWGDATGDRSRAHLLHGVKLEAVDDYRRCAFYISLYASTKDQDRDDIHTGRGWGLWRKAELGLSPLTVQPLHVGEFAVVRRVLRGLYKSHQWRTKGLSVRGIGRAGSGSRYGHALRTNQPLTNFLPFDQSTRLVRWAASVADEARNQFSGSNDNPAPPRGRWLMDYTTQHA